MIDALKEFTRMYLANFVLWLMTNVFTLIFMCLEIPLLQYFKKNPAINFIPIIITAFVGAGTALITELSFFYIFLGLTAGGAMGYWADRYCARHIGEKISGASNKSFRNILFRKSSSSSTSSTRDRSSSPKSTNSNFGGGNFSGGGGSSSW